MEVIEVYENGVVVCMEVNMVEYLKVFVVFD